MKASKNIRQIYAGELKNDPDSHTWGDVQPFTGEYLPAAQEVPAVLAEVAAQREVAQVQAAMAVAKRFPRNQAKAVDRIMVACQRPSLAEKALYSYARGGTEITGPSIRLAEAIAQQWGNIEFGIRELEQRVGESTVEAYAWDLETNTRQAKTFQVKHRRFTKKGSYDLSDPRDIYELVANQGARRLRACILGVIPGDVVDAAVEQCEITLKAKVDISPESVQKMVGVFGELGITREQLEARIQRRLDSITSAQVVALRKIYNSLRDGMSKAEDWFEKASETPPMALPPETKEKGKEKTPPPPPETRTEVLQKTPPPVINGDAPRGATETQVYSIYDLCSAANMAVMDALKNYGVSSVEELTQEDAAELIRDLQKI